MTHTGWIWTVVVCIVALWASVAHATPDLALWETLDIVPMPKEIELTGRELPSADAVLVLGASASRQDEIGAQWINDRIAQLGGQPLSVVSAAEATDAPLRIVIGTRESNSVIEAAAAAATIELGPGEPGEKGYVILSHPHGEATEILLAGADNIGALYACVTLAELMFERDGTVLVREAQVTDWPDFLNSTLAGREGTTACPEVGLLAEAVKSRDGFSEQVRENYLSAVREQYDRLLRWKVPALQYHINLTNSFDLSPQARGVFREAIEYGKERGIGALLYPMMPFAGRVKDYPDFQGPSVQNPRWENWIRCWSLDDMRRQTAEDFAIFCRDLGVTDVGFHDTDTGGFYNPAQWNERCDKCHERWGDDYAAATAHKHQIYYDALKRHAPDARVHFTLYLYNIGIFTGDEAERYAASRLPAGTDVAEAGRALREKWEGFWRRMTQMLPQDITFCIRETTQESVDAYRKFIGDRGIFTWFAIWGRRDFLGETPRSTGTFYGNPWDFLHPQTDLELFVPFKALATVEYAWNTKAPGAAPFGARRREFRQPAGEISEVIYPHVVRNLFGRRVADEITAAASKSIYPAQICEQRRRSLRTYEQVRSQADAAAEAMALMDAAWAKRQSPDDHLGMNDYAFRRFLYLREVSHSCRWLAEVRSHALHARELIREGKLEEAQVAVEAGRAAVEQGKQDSEALLAERPEDPVYKCRAGNAWQQRFRQYTPGAELDWDVALGWLEETET